MNLEELKEDIAKEEGLKYQIYRCSEGYPTAGIGHLITEWDEEYYGMPIGTEVSKEQVDKWFETDLYVAINDMEKFTADMQVDENVKECGTERGQLECSAELHKSKNHDHPSRDPVEYICRRSQGSLQQELRSCAAQHRQE